MVFGLGEVVLLKVFLILIIVFYYHFLVGNKIIWVHLGSDFDMFVGFTWR